MKIKEIKTYRVISLGDREDLNLEELRDINSDDKALVIQIYGHAGVPGIQGHNKGQIYGWDQVVELVSLIKTRNPIRLDLCGVCNIEEQYGSRSIMYQRVRIPSMTSWSVWMKRTSQSPLKNIT